MPHTLSVLPNNNGQKGTIQSMTVLLLFKKMAESKIVVVYLKKKEKHKLTLSVKKTYSIITLLLQCHSFVVCIHTNLIKSNLSSL